MEVKGATFLYTLAGLMISFAGFSALLLTVRAAAGARLSLLDRYLAKTVMTHVFVLTAAALLPALFALYDIQEKSIWPASGVLFAIPMLLFRSPIHTDAARWPAADHRPQYSRSSSCSALP